jgi:tRNA U34 5-carboxymethylaminomethyl modifying GTPase MnmE/TrmE
MQCPSTASILIVSIFVLFLSLATIYFLISRLSLPLIATPRSLAGCGGTEDPLITRERHRAHLQQCVDRLRACASHLRDRDAATLVLAAEELRQAIRALGCVTGRVEVEDLLDVIFRDFCIGK